MLHSATVVFLLQNVLDEDVKEFKILFFDLLYGFIDKFIKFVFVVLRRFVKRKILTRRYLCEDGWILVMCFNFNQVLNKTTTTKLLSVGWWFDLMLGSINVVVVIHWYWGNWFQVCWSARFNCWILLHKLGDKFGNFYAILAFFF